MPYSNLTEFSQKCMKKSEKEKEKEMMFVGYANDHSGDIFRFLNMDTTSIILSRSMCWLQIMIINYIKRENRFVFR